MDWAPLRIGFLALWRPGVMLALMLVAAVFLAEGRGARRRRNAGRMVCFLLGLAALYAALAGPVGALALRGLYSAELTAGGLLVYVAVPLLMYGAPAAWTERLVSRPRGRALVRVLTHPVAAPLVLNLLLFAYAAGLAALPDGTALGTWATDLEDLALSLAAAASWWPVLGAAPGLPRLADLARAVYLLVNWLAVTAVSAYVLLGGAPGGGAAAVGGSLPWALTPLVDRQVGGVVFSVLSHASYGLATAVVLVHWVRRENLTASPQHVYRRLRTAGFSHDEARQVANLAPPDEN